MKTIITKIVVIFLIIAIAANGFAFPRKAQALFGVVDVVFDPSTFATAVTTLTKMVIEWVKENSQKILRDVIAKRLIDYTVDQTVNWIQGGGSPKFVTDWKGFLKDAGNIAFDEVIRDVGLSRLCSPFKLQIQLSLSQAPEFSQRLNCTLDDIVGNIEDFYNDFSKGGWVAYNAAWEPQNNYYGAMLMINDEALLRINQKTEAAKNEVIAGGGYTSEKICVGFTVTKEQLDDLKKYDLEKYTAAHYIKDVQGNYCPEKYSDIATPGSLIGKAIGEAITSDIGWAQSIESWASALLNAAINRLTKKGLSGMAQSSDYSAGSYYPEEYKDLAQSQTRVVSKNDQISQVTEISAGWQNELDIKNRTASSTAQLIVVLNELDSRNCSSTVLDKDCGYTPSSWADEILIDDAYLQGLNGDITSLSDKIDSTNKLIVGITNATTSEAMAISDLAFVTFMEAYSKTGEVNDVLNRYYNSVAGTQGTEGASCSNIAATSTQAVVAQIVKGTNDLIKDSDWNDVWGCTAWCLAGGAIGGLICAKKCKNYLDSIAQITLANTILTNLAKGNFTGITQAKINGTLSDLQFIVESIQLEAAKEKDREKTSKYAGWIVLLNLEADEIKKLGEKALTQLAAEKEAEKMANELKYAQDALRKCILTSTSTSTQP